MSVEDGSLSWITLHHPDHNILCWKYSLLGTFHLHPMIPVIKLYWKLKINITLKALYSTNLFPHFIYHCINNEQNYCACFVQNWKMLHGIVLQCRATLFWRQLNHPFISYGPVNSSPSLLETKEILSILHFSATNHVCLINLVKIKQWKFTWRNKSGNSLTSSCTALFDFNHSW